MGVSSSPAELQRKLVGFALAVGDPKVALGRVGIVGKAIYQSERSRKVSGTTPISKKVKERFDVKGREVVIRYTGPAHLLNNPAKPHFIGARRRSGRQGSRRRGARALTIGGTLRASAAHPGHKGLGFHQKAKARARRELPPVYARAGVTEPMRRIFR